MPAPRSSRGSNTVRLKPSDPFDLIRLLAQSQSDPRKAVCELVQNSLDAQARHIEITWKNEHGVRTLRIWDDGRGVFPELGRDEALRRIATTIGHSHKRDLTPNQRRELMALGKYGIGLIGFWCVGKVMEIKSRVGGETLVLRLERDREQATILPARGRRIDDAGTARIGVRAAQKQLRAEFVVDVAVLAELAGQERTAGIPEPLAVHAPGERWRSRLVAGRWEFNAGHRDFLEVQASEARRVRYLTQLFVKEVVLRNFGDPSSGEILERMVEILTRLDAGRGQARERPNAVE